MNKLLCTLSLSFLALNLSAAELKSIPGGPTVKKSASGICHAKDSHFYAKIKRFTAYDTLKACIDSGGQMPATKTKT